MKDIQSKRLKTKIYPSVSKLLRPNRKFTAILEQNCKSEYGSVCSKDYVGVLTKKTPHLNALYYLYCIRLKSFTLKFECYFEALF